MEKIAKDQYVELGLRPVNLKKLPLQEPTLVQISKFIGGKMLPISDLADWAKAWAVRGANLAT